MWSASSTGFFSFSSRLYRSKKCITAYTPKMLQRCMFRLPSPEKKEGEGNAVVTRERKRDVIWHAICFKLHIHHGDFCYIFDFTLFCHEIFPFSFCVYSLSCFLISRE